DLRPPARALVPDRDARDIEPVKDRQFGEPGRQFRPRAGAQRPALLDGERGRRDPLALSGDPVDVPPDEGVRLAARAAAGDGDADAAVRFDPQDVAPGPPVAHEVHRVGWRVLAEGKAELHGATGYRGSFSPWRRFRDPGGEGSGTPLYTSHAQQL